MNPQPRIVSGLAEWSSLKPLGAAWIPRSCVPNAPRPYGKHMQIVATGLRTAKTRPVEPATGELWCIVNERDELGDNTPFDYAAHT